MAALAGSFNFIHRQLLVRSDIGDELLAAFYIRCKADALLEYLYPDGWQPSLLEFIQWSRQPNVIVCGGFVRGSNVGLIGQDAPLQVAALGWLSGIKRFPTHSVADIGHGFLRQFMVGELPTEMGSLFLDFAFNTAKIDLLCGATPVPNRAARIFVAKMGFKRVGEIPMMANWKGSPCAALISYLTREDWVCSR